MVKKSSGAKGSSSSTAAAGEKPPSPPRPTASATATAAAAEGAVGPQCDWDRSLMTEREKKKMVKMGFLPRAEGDVILPGADPRPNPPPGFTVIFLAYLLRGLSLPAHEFLRCLLFSYGIQLWQLTPNSLLHLAIFITICESFLGIEPHFGLWKKIFFLKRHSNNQGSFVIGGVGFSVRTEVKWINFPMRESVQDWRQKWFYVKDEVAPHSRAGLPKFEDVLEAKPKKSWTNMVTAEESAVVETLYNRVQKLKLFGTEVAALFLKRRVQPLQHRAHPMYHYTGAKDSTRISAEDLTEKELQDEVRRLTKLTQKDNISLESNVRPFETSYLPPADWAVPRSFPLNPESSEAPEDADVEAADSKAIDSEATMEDADEGVESSQELGDDADDEAAGFIMAARPRDVERQSSPESSQEANVQTSARAAPSPSPPSAPKQSKGGFAGEEDLDSDDEEEVDAPPAKRPRTDLAAAAAPKVLAESKIAEPSAAAVVMPSAAAAAPSAVVVAPSSATDAPSTAAAAPAKEHPIFSSIQKVSEFAAQLVNVEAENANLKVENAQLRRDLTEQVQAAEKLTEEAWQSNEDLKAESAQVKEELVRVKEELMKAKEELAMAKEAEEQKKKEEADAKTALRHLLKAADNLLAAADIPVNRADELQVKAMDDPISFAAEAIERVQALVEKSKGALSTMFSLVFPKLPQDKSFDEMAQTFTAKGSSRIEVLKSTSRILGALYAFQLLMGYGVKVDFEEMLLDLPKAADGTEVDLTQFTVRARKCARQLISLAEGGRTRNVDKDTPSASAQTIAP